MKTYFILKYNKKIKEKLSEITKIRPSGLCLNGSDDISYSFHKVGKKIETVTSSVAFKANIPIYSFENNTVSFEGYLKKFKTSEIKPKIKRDLNYTSEVISVADSFIFFFTLRADQFVFINDIKDTTKHSILTKSKKSFYFQSFGKTIETCLKNKEAMKDNFLYGIEWKIEEPVKKKDGTYYTPTYKVYHLLGIVSEFIKSKENK